MSITPPITGSIYPVIVNNIFVTKQQAYIEIRDINGNPINGNGIIVNYNEIKNGVTTAKSIAIAGQSYPLYFGTYNDTYGWIITSFIPNVDTAPPIGRCDLVINSINIDKPASAVNTADAQITASAFSSYLPIQYSIDNSTWQLSPTFTGLQGGVLTVYCKDGSALGCTAQRSVTIPVTANLLTSDPSVRLNDYNTSRWNAAFNPIIFTYQRRDFGVTAVSLDSLTGNANISINGDMSAVRDTVTANQNPVYIYINAGPYAGTFTVLSATGSSIVINTPYTTTAIGFVNINLLRPYYKVFTQITYIDPLSGAINTIISTNRPDNQGVVKADISNFLQSILRIKDTSDYSQVNFRDTNLSASYTIRYAENYDDGTIDGKTSSWISIDAPYYVTYTARQIQSPNGGNLAQYVPFPALYPSTQTTPAKWITEFAEPAYSNAYPFDISFIYSEAIAGRQLYYKVILLDINRQPLSLDTIVSYILNEDSSWLINQDASKLIIAAQSLINTPIVEQVGLNRLRINFNLPNDVYYFTLALFYDDAGSNPVQVTKTQTIRVDRAPDINAVYMRWIGLTGSWNYYRFNYNQEVSLDVQNATIIKNFVQDWATQDGIEEVISKDAGQKIKLMAEDLSVADIKGLQSIKYSPKVQMLISASPVKWQTVVLNTATFSEYETLNGQAPFSITFNQPSINIQTQ